MPDSPDNHEKNPGGRPPVLDERKRRIVLALLANGSSQRVAARYVGCSPSTIANTIDRDPEFADVMAQAEQNSEIEALRLLRNAARKDRYWRAAAWLPRTEKSPRLRPATLHGTLRRANRATLPCRRLTPSQQHARRRIRSGVRSFR